MLAAHLLSLGFVVGVTAVSDKEALEWFMGRAPVLDRRRVRLYHKLVWLGLVALILTGTYMAWPMRAFLLSDPVFIAKMLFVGILIVNAFLIGRLMHVTFNMPYANVPREQKMHLLASGAISAFSWCAAAVLGLLLF